MKDFIKNNSLFFVVLLIHVLFATITLVVVFHYFDNLIQVGHYNSHKRFIISIVILSLAVVNIATLNIFVLSAYKIHKYLFYFAFFISIILWLGAIQIITELKGMLNYDIYTQIYSTQNLNDIVFFMKPVLIILLISIVLIYILSKLNFTNKNFFIILLSNIIVAIGFYFLAQNMHYNNVYKKGIQVVYPLKKLPSIKLITPPLNILYSNIRSQRNIKITKEEKAKVKYLINPKNFEHNDEQRRIIIWNIGESAVASHFYVNGYKRQTNPEITNLIKNGYKINSFTRGYSIYSSSTPSHLQMFYSQALIFGSKNLDSRKEIYNISTLYKNKSIFYLLKEQGFKMYFLSQFFQYPYFREPNMTKEEVMGWSRDDTETQYKKIISLVEKHKNDDLLILTYGYGGNSHTNYTHYDTKKFNFYTSKEKNDINKYDDSIMSLDYSLAKLYKWAKDRDENIMVAYFSDHGEGVDYGLSHGYRDKEHKIPTKKGRRSADRTVLNPAAMIFFNDAWRKNINDDILYSKSFINGQRYSLERIFFDILSCSGIREKKPWLFKEFYEKPYGVCKINL